MKNRYDEPLAIRYEAPDLLISGPLTHTTVMSALSQCCALFPPQTSVRLNLKGVTACDSASLALLIALLRFGKQNGNTVTFSDLPKQMQELSQVSGLKGILPVL